MKKQTSRIVIQEHRGKNISTPISTRDDVFVRFSLSKCTVGGKNCILKVPDRQTLDRIYKSLGHFEKMTWGMLQRLPREQGITLEKKGSDLMKNFQRQHPSMENFGHIRVDGTGTPNRIFLGIEKDLAFILYFDLKGKIHH